MKTLYELVLVCMLAPTLVPPNDVSSDAALVAGIRMLASPIPADAYRAKNPSSSSICRTIHCTQLAVDKLASKVFRCGHRPPYIVG
jgi:hypothetical protein